MKMLFIQCEKMSSDAELQMQPRCHVLKLMLRAFYHNLNDFKIFQTSATQISYFKISLMSFEYELNHFIFFSQKFKFYLINTKKVFINGKLQAQHKYHVLKLVSGHFNLIEMIMKFFIKFKFQFEKYVIRSRVACTTQILCFKISPRSF